MTWDIATLDELQRRRNAFVKSWGEVIDDMRAEAAAEANTARVADSSSPDRAAAGTETTR